MEQWIAADHPIRTIKRMVDEILAGMSTHFDEIYAADGRPSVPPEAFTGALARATRRVGW